MNPDFRAVTPFCVCVCVCVRPHCVLDEKEKTKVMRFVPCRDNLHQLLWSKKKGHSDLLKPLRHTHTCAHTQVGWVFCHLTCKMHHICLFLFGPPRTGSSHVSSNQSDTLSQSPRLCCEHFMQACAELWADISV